MELFEGKMATTLIEAEISTRLERIAELARNAPEMAFTNIAHHLDVTWLTEAFRRVNRRSAPGIDGVTAETYEANLQGNLQSLVERVKANRYRAPAVRRVHIPKGDGTKTRPIGIPTLEDKVLQRGVAMLLEAIYEQDFSDCSYGFRPGRAPRQAVQATWDGLMRLRGGWVLDVDIQSFFDDLDHGHLRKFLDRRVQDKGVRRLIGKWLKAGVMDDGTTYHPTSGTPQGGVVSPILANIYLHEVIDTWFEKDVQPRMAGPTFLVRYADDFVMVFQNERDARRVLEVLPKRLGRYGLTMHPDKTRLVRFSRPPRKPPRWTGRWRRKTHGENFDFLGFTFHWGLSRRGTSIVCMRTMKSRLARALRAISTWCRFHRHDPVNEQARVLGAKLRGHYNYYGVRGNYRALERFRRQVVRTWRKWLNRRSQRGRMTWPRFTEMLGRHPLPPPRIRPVAS